MNKLLSPKLFQVAEQIALFGTKKEVASNLNISVRTVETYAKIIYKILGITKLNELVLWYCGTAYDIKYLLEERKYELLKAIALFVFAIHIAYSNTQVFRIRRCRREVEIAYITDYVPTGTFKTI